MSFFALERYLLRFTPYPPYHCAILVPGKFGARKRLKSDIAAARVVVGVLSKACGGGSLVFGSSSWYFADTYRGLIGLYKYT